MPKLRIIPSVLSVASGARKVRMRTLILTLLMGMSVGVLMAELGSNIPTDDQLNMVRVQEGRAGGAGWFAISTPPPGSLVSPLPRVSRAARATPTNFKVTSLDPSTGGGRPAGTLLADGSPNPGDNLDAVNGPGRTAAFTTFGAFNPNHADAANNPPGIGFFDPLDGM